MNTTSPAATRIEYLESNHFDGKTEHAPKIKPWQLRVAQFLFSTFGSVSPQYMARLAYKIFATPRHRAKHRQPDDLIRAAKVIDLPFDGHIVKLYEWEKEPDAPIILLAHGWESRGTALRMFVKPLLNKGFKVVAFDALAHGDSDGSTNNLLTNARTIAAIHAHYGNIYGAIGHSFGCSSLVYAQQFVNNAIDFQRLVFLAVPHRTKRIMDGFLAYMNAPNAVKKAFFHYIESLTKQPIETSDTALAYPSVKVGQLLLIHDQDDDVTSIDAAERVVEHWDNALLLVTKGYGHFRIAKNPDVIRRIVDFLEMTKNEDF
ncbi:MAG: alpha/beta hydrolase [Saprospiraceae bacterium]|nr:alpha/beta hydrolase [Saprospiraceae bacterium]